MSETRPAETVDAHPSVEKPPTALSRSERILVAEPDQPSSWIDGLRKHAAITNRCEVLGADRIDGEYSVVIDRQRA
jgi:hypothetical protein